MIEHFGGWFQYKSVHGPLLERQIAVWQARVEARVQQDEEYKRELGV
jgi:hypothetical protein